MKKTIRGKGTEVIVAYEGGESRYHAEKAVDYMLAVVPTDEGDIELYAETEPVEGDETGTYDELKSEIIEQARRYGIDPSMLRFWYDYEKGVSEMTMTKKQVLEAICEIASKNTDFDEGFDVLFGFMATHPDSKTTRQFIEYHLEIVDSGNRDRAVLDDGSPSFVYLIGRDFRAHEWVANEDMEAFQKYALREYRDWAEGNLVVPSEVLWTAEYGERTQYAIGRAGNRYYFSWSEWRWPKDGHVPAENIEDGTNGIHWYGSLAEAVDDAHNAIECLSDVHQNWAEETLAGLGDLPLTTAEAAKMLGVTEIRVRKLCQAGRMGYKVRRDGTWIIPLRDVENFERRRAGRPKWVTMDLSAGIEKVTLTKRGTEVLRERIPVRDLADELKAGQTISYRTFAYEGGQTGHILIIHSDRQGRVDRAGIFFGGHSSWGDWDEESKTVRLDVTDEDGLPIVYDSQGRRVTK